MCRGTLTLIITLALPTWCPWITLNRWLPRGHRSSFNFEKQLFVTVSPPSTPAALWKSASSSPTSPNKPRHIPVRPAALDRVWQKPRTAQHPRLFPVRPWAKQECEVLTTSVFTLFAFSPECQFLEMIGGPNIKLMDFHTCLLCNANDRGHVLKLKAIGSRGPTQKCVTRNLCTVPSQIPCPPFLANSPPPPP